MPGHSKSFSKPNDEWLKAQVDWIRLKLDKSEISGFTSDTKEQILKQTKSMLNS